MDKLTIQRELFLVQSQPTTVIGDMNYRMRTLNAPARETEPGVTQSSPYYVNVSR